MGTASSKAIAPALAALALAATGCGGGGRHGASASGFAWLHPAAAPSTWHTVTIPSGASLSYPPRWHEVAGDPETATAGLLGADGSYLGYLNLTPRQGSESLTNFASFRTEHNAEDGDSDLQTFAFAHGLRFRSGHGTCVHDAYTTRTGARYIELACLVEGARTTSVIVGAAPPQAWAQISPLLEQAMSALTT